MFLHFSRHLLPGAAHQLDAGSGATDVIQFSHHCSANRKSTGLSTPLNTPVIILNKETADYPPGFFPVQEPAADLSPYSPLDNCKLDQGRDDSVLLECNAVRMVKSQSQCVL